MSEIAMEIDGFTLSGIAQVIVFDELPSAVLPEQVWMVNVTDTDVPDGA